jgi:hypothetical protein
LSKKRPIGVKTSKMAFGQNFKRGFQKATWTSFSFGNYVVDIFMQCLLKKKKCKGRGAKWNTQNFDII